MLYGNSLRALKLAGAGVGTASESELIHLSNHGLSPSLCLRTTLRKKCEGTYAGSYKEHCRAVFAGSDTSTATYASSSIHTLLSLVMRDKKGVSVRS